MPRRTSTSTRRWTPRPTRSRVYRITRPSTRRLTSPRTRRVTRCSTPGTTRRRRTSRSSSRGGDAQCQFDQHLGFLITASAGTPGFPPTPSLRDLRLSNRPVRSGRISGSRDRTSPGPGHVHPAGRRSPPWTRTTSWRWPGRRPADRGPRRPRRVDHRGHPHFPGWDSFGALVSHMRFIPRPREARQEDRGGHRLAPRRRRRAPDPSTSSPHRSSTSRRARSIRPALGSPRRRKAMGAARFRQAVPAVGDQHRAGDERRRLVREEQHTRGDLVGVPLRLIGSGCRGRRLERQL